MADLSLKSLQQRIAQQDTELQRLRQELESRQSQFTSLNQRRQALQAELRQVEQELIAVAEGKTVVPKAPQRVPSKKAPSKPSVATKVASSQAQKTASLSLPALIVAVVREAGMPVTAKQLVVEVKKRGFRSKSADFAKMVKVRVYDLVKRGLIKRTPDQSGLVPVRAFISKHRIRDHPIKERR